MSASLPQTLFPAVKQAKTVPSAATIVTVNPHRVSAAPTTLSKKILKLRDYKQTNKPLEFALNKTRTSEAT